MATLFLGPQGIAKPRDLGLDEDENGSWVPSQCDVDEYHTVVMGERTVDYIAKTLKRREAILIAFKADDSTQYDLCFSIVPNVRGPVQRGARAGDLMVAAMGLGSFCFDISAAPVTAEYVMEKLRFIRSEEITADIEAVASLITQVRTKLEEIA